MSAAEGLEPYFLDTNILVYAFDHTAPAKRETANTLIRDALSTRQGMISSQVVQEFLSAALRRFVTPMTVDACREHLAAVLLPLCDHYPSPATYEHAIEIVAETGYNLYDALILAAAVESGCRTLLTEDLQHGRVVQGVMIVNPFAG
jgi:predicted nucleic acid-binding protein